MSRRDPSPRSLSRLAAGALVALAVAAPSRPAAADGRIVYGNTTTTPQARAYTASTNAYGGAAGAGGAAAANPAFMVQRASATRNEHLAGYVTTGGTLYVLRWNGTAWSNEWNVSVGGNGVDGRRFDIAYEGSSGRAVVVYSRNAPNGLAYRIWDGTSWGAATSFSTARLGTGATTVPTWVKLLPRPGSDEIALVAEDNGTATANTSSLTAMVSDGNQTSLTSLGWANEPSAALATNMTSTTTQAVQNEAFDLAWETQSGVLWVFWTQSTPQQYRRSLGAARPAGTWSAATSFATGHTLPLQMHAASDPQGNNVLLAWNSGANVYASVDAGGTWSTVTTLSTTGWTTAASKRTVASEWLVSGGTSYPVVLWGTNNTINVTVGRNRATVSGTTVAWGTAGTNNFNAATTGWAWMDTAVDPGSPDTLMLTYSDGSNDLWSRRLVFVGATPSYTWTDATGGTALTTALTNVTSQAFAFAYDRGSIALSNGTDPANATIASGGIAALDAFQTTVTSGTATISSVTVSLTNPAALTNVFVNSAANCAGTTYGTATAPAGTTVVSTTGLTATGTQTFYVCVTGANVAAATAVTGFAQTAAAVGYPVSGSSAAGTTVTVMPTVTLSAATNPPNASVVSGGVAAVDAFQTAVGGSASISSVTVSLTNPSALSSVFVNDAASCAGTTWGTSTVLGTTTDIATPGLTATGTQTFYVCVTGGATAAETAVTGFAQTLVAPGFVVTGSSSAGTTVTVTPPVDGRIFYSVNTTTPQARPYYAQSNGFGAAGATAAGATPTFMVDRASRTRSEHIAGYVTSGGILYVYRWNGSTWINETSAAGGWGGTVTVGGDGVNGRRFDIAYEGSSGRAVVVYSRNAANAFAYRVWDGTAWGAATNFSSARLGTGATTVPTWVKLLPRPGSDEIALLAQDNGTTTGNNSSLTAMVSDGNQTSLTALAWGNEPSAALATNMTSTIGQLVQNEAFDLAWEAQSGVLWVFWTQSTPQQYRRSLGAARPTGTWSTATSFATGHALPLQMFAASDPLSNDVVVGWNRSTTVGVYASVKASGTWSSVATAVSAGTTPQTPAIQKRTVAGRWLVTGATSYPVVLWGTSTQGQIGTNVATISGTSATWGTAATSALGGTTWAWMDAQADDLAQDTLVLAYSDGGSDLWAKRLVLTPGPTLTWSSADGGTALTTTLTTTNGILTQNFSFAFDRIPLSLVLDTGPGEPPSRTITWLQAAALDAFTLAAGTGTAGISSVTVSVTGNTGVQSLSIQNTSACNMATPYGELTGGIAAGANTIPITGLAVGATPVALWVCMDAAQTAASVAVTGVVTSAAAPRYRISGSDGSTAVVTVVPPPNLVLGTGADPSGTTSITVDGMAVLDAFTIAAESGSASVTTVTVSLTNPTALRNVFVTTSSICTGGTNYGFVSSPTAPSASIPTTGLSVGANPLALYVCGTAAQVAANTTVTPVTVTSVAAAGYGLTGADGNTTTTVVVTPPPNVAIGTGTGADPTTNASVTVDGVARLDGFTLTASAGTATIASVTVSLTNPSALQNVFVNGAVGCGGTTYGTVASPGASQVITISSLAVGTGGTTLYVCGTGALVAASTAVTPATVTAVTASGYVQGAAGDTAGAGVISVIPPTSNLTIATGAAPEPSNGNVTYDYPPPVAPADKFTLAAPANGTAVTSISASVQSTAGAAVKNVFISSDPACGTSLGVVGGTGGEIPITGLTIGTAATTLYVCITAGLADAVATVSGGTVTAARALGQGSTGSDSTTTTVTVNPPTARPTISIVNPRPGAKVSGGGAGGLYKVQARVHLPGGIAGITGVALSTNGGSTFPTPMSQNPNYDSGSPATATLYEATIANATVAAGVVLEARATTATTSADSEPVTIDVVAARSGDGTLLVRDNANQLCSDCHSLLTHSSEGTGLQYRSWAVQCRDCHTPHGTRNLSLVRESITPPTLGGPATAPRNVGFTTKTGDSGAPGWDAVNARPAPTASYVNTDYTGPCQVCHTRTQNRAGAARYRNAGTSDGHYAGERTMRCAACHMHKAGFKGGSCVTCHAEQQTITKGPEAGKTRRAVVLEFNNTWSHKRSAGGTVTEWDCVVCHMEGDPATGGPSAVHADGYVNLRDPDTGQNIKGVTFTGPAPGVAAGGTSPGSYASTADDLVFARFSRNLASAALEPAVQATMINQCLHCHDADGAASPLARVPGGSAEKPFATTISGPAYTGAGVTANGVAGGVTNVSESFQTTNSSYHPIRGRQNNWFARGTRMNAPWNLAKASGSATTTEWGYLLSCWDCHALPTDSGTITQTVTAHGGTATLRGNATASGTAPTATTGATLCWVCHAGYNGASPTHGSGSAMSTSGDSGMTPFMQYGCNRCHSSNYTTAVVRPVRAQDVHGVNALPTTGGTKSGRWASTTLDSRPYAFIRNTTSLAEHTPLNIGGTGFTPQCAHLNDNPCSTRTETYTVGGTF